MDGALYLNVLRVIDKYDKVGVDGVIKLLSTGLEDSSGTFIVGLGLNQYQIHVITEFLSTKGETNQETINNLYHLFCKLTAVEMIVKNDMVVSRLEVINILDDVGLLDWFVVMPVNSDNEWSPGNRPYNIGWAIDDLIKAHVFDDTIDRDQLKHLIQTFTRL